MNFPARSCTVVVGLAVLVLLLTSPAHSVTIEWTNSGTGLFSDPANWSTGTVPGTIAFGNATNDEARVSNGGTTVIDATQSVSPQFVLLASATGTTGNLQMTGGTLTTASDIRVSGQGGAATSTTTAGGTAVFTQSGGTVLMQGGNLNVGYGDTAVGTYNLSGGTFELDGASIVAIGNRGVGTMNQSGGSIYVRGPLTGTAATVGVGQINLGRNGAVATGNPGTSSGTYTLSAGDVTAAQLRYGNNASGAATGSTNTFNLQGGSLTVGTISIVNTNAANSFNFVGGSLTAASIAIPLTNNGGTLSPASLFFGSVTVQPPSTAAEVRTSQIGTTTFTLGNSYVQTSTGILSIEIAAAGSNDFLDIGGGTANIGTANLGGSIAVSLLNAFNPALGSTFDILTADTITNSATVSGQTASGLRFAPSIVTGGDARQVLRLTVVPEPVSSTLLLAGGVLLSLARRRQGTRV